LFKSFLDLFDQESNNVNEIREIYS